MTQPKHFFLITPADLIQALTCLTTDGVNRLRMMKGPTAPAAIELELFHLTPG
ncbi:hypothetical protein M1E17_17515 [Arthrobacter sp. D1-29]